MKILVTTAVGSGPTKLAAFDDALNKAGVANFNLLKLSSVIPTNTELKILNGKIRNVLGGWGDKLYVVMADMRVDTPNQEAWAGIGWIQNKLTGKGVFVEHEGSSKESVSKDIKDSLKSLIEHRPGFSGEQGMLVKGGLCKGEPICALAVAVYESEGWKSN